MDLRTVQFYNANAEQAGQRYAGVESVAARYFSVAFPTGGRVLDVGSGGGRDLDALLQAGYEAFGVDASETMLKEAARWYPKLSARLACETLPNLSTIADDAYDGVLCWAVLMHLSEEFLFDTVFNLRRILKKGGRLLISTPVERPDIDPASRRDGNGRLFNEVTPENFRFLLEKVGFKLLNRWNTEDSLGRPGHHWATQLFVLEEQGSRSLDKIEGILNRDKKDATYKPALFRALAEMATTSYHTAKWLPDGRVAIPLKLIADKWLEYYWPLFESGIFIPQKRGEKPECLKPVAFRAELEGLIALYRNMGGLCGFSIAYRANKLPPQVAQLHQSLQRRLCDTIRDGPVYYSGGGGSETFIYHKPTKCVHMDADLWRELSAMGHWIADATILRWAELTAEISQGALKPSQVIDQLLTSPIPEREVHAARCLYERLSEKVCIWTDRSLREFDVDHAIPFILWGNNDLWNLLPALPSINNHKRDRLPTRDLLRARKDCLVHYWTLMREEHTTRFEFEMARFAGPVAAGQGSWENRLFGAVAEAVEFTAIQRGIDRWQPVETRVAQPARRLESGASAARADPQTAAEGGPTPIVIDPPQGERFVVFVPFYDLEAAAGGFGPEQLAVDTNEHCTWIRVENRRLTPDMFAIRVRGHSMEPKIPHDSICLFRGGEALAGSRQGRIVLVRLRDSVDPETGGNLTVKSYFSEKVPGQDVEFEHRRIILKPLNREYAPIEINHAEEGALKVIGEFVGVIRPGAVGR